MAEAEKTLKDAVNDTRIGFMNTEIDLGLTFVQVAVTTRSHQTKERNRRNAQAAQCNAMKSERCWQICSFR